MDFGYALKKKKKPTKKMPLSQSRFYVELILKKSVHRFSGCLSINVSILSDSTLTASDS